MPYWDIFCPNTCHQEELMPRRKSLEIENLVIKLFENKSQLSLSEVADAAGLSKSDEADRKAIRRVLNKLIEKRVLSTRGEARARVYIYQKAMSMEEKKPTTKIQGAFDNITISSDSKNLLDYLSQPIQTRNSVGYNHDFLKSYKPSHTAYLNPNQRAQLHAIGKVENIVRPAGTYARNILNRLLIDLSWNSSRLEGNTYSLLETKRLIELGETAIGKDATETQMILNHKNAIEYIIESVDEPQISSLQVCSIHALLSENLLGDPSACGRLRQIGVGISGSTYLPLDNPHLLREFFDRFIEKLNLINDPFEQSFYSIVHLSYLQAFEDVNKRTGRLVANIPLIKNNLKPLSFTDVNQRDYSTALLGVYEKNDISLLSDLYIWAYQKSSERYSATQQSLGEPNLLKLKYRNLIHEIIRTIILDKVAGNQISGKIRSLIDEQKLPEPEAGKLFQIIEIEIASLHERNIARFKILPHEFQDWMDLQSK